MTVEDYSFSKTETGDTGSALFIQTVIVTQQPTH